jgi:hypothetical protein
MKIDGQLSSPNSQLKRGDQAQRVLTLTNFKKALKEISASSSELQGSAAELRKWNELYGEGAKDRRQKLWGAGRFGFTHGESSQTK